MRSKSFFISSFSGERPHRTFDWKRFRCRPEVQVAFWWRPEMGFSEDWKRFPIDSGNDSRHHRIDVQYQERATPLVEKQRSGTAWLWIVPSFPLISYRSLVHNAFSFGKIDRMTFSHWLPMETAVAVSMKTRGWRSGSGFNEDCRGFPIKGGFTKLIT
jgi:hypothetical protein